MTAALTLLLHHSKKTGYRGNLSYFPYLPFSGSAFPFNFCTSFALLRRMDARNLDKEPLRLSFPG